MKHLFIIQVLFCVVLAAASCTKEESKTRNHITLLAIEEFSSDKYEYSYDANNRLSRVVYTSSFEPSLNFTASVTAYGPNGEITELIKEYEGLQPDEREVISYNANGRPSQRNSFSKLPAGEMLTLQYFYEYAANNITIKWSVNGSAPANHVVYTLNANGNITEITLYKSGVAATRVEYSAFDNKKHPYENISKGWSQFFYSSNNYQAAKSTQLSTGTVKTLTITREYDADGYPVKQTVFNGTSTLTGTFSYIKK